MGTSDSGAGGGSGGSGGGGGSGGVGAGSLALRNGELREIDPAQQDAWDALQGVFSRLTPDYIRFIMGDDAVRAAYEALHWLHIVLVQDRSWAKVQKRFKISDGHGCLLELIGKLCTEAGPYAVNPQLQAVLFTSLKDFFLEVVGDPVVRDLGDAREVLQQVNRKAFDSISAIFLGAYLKEALRQEEKGLSRLARKRLAEFSLAKANQIVAAFQQTFRNQPWQEKIPQVSFTHLFQIMKAESEWLIKQLRKNVPIQQPV
jgi:hypothetical protein